MYITHVIGSQETSPCEGKIIQSQLLQWTEMGNPKVDRMLDRQTDQKTDWQTDRHTDRQRGRQTDRLTD